MKLSVDLKYISGNDENTETLTPHYVTFPENLTLGNSYKGYLGHEREGGTETEPKVEFVPSVAFAPDVNCYIKVSKFSFSHEMYKPLQIKLSMVVTSIDPADIKKGDSASEISFADLRRMILALYNSSYSLDITPSGSSEIRVYKNLLVTDLKYSLPSSATKTYTLDMVIHSPDYAMTLNKRSVCYTGKTLSEVAKDSVSTFKNVKANVSNLSFLSSDPEGDSKSVEYVLPYLVQYQESNYDFLCRIARRYGEVMFYSCADSQLHIGYDMTSKISKNSTASSYSSIDYHASVIDLNSTQIHMQYHQEDDKVIVESSAKSKVDLLKATSKGDLSISNRGLNAGRNSDATADWSASEASTDDYNYANDFVSKDGKGTYTCVNDYILLPNLLPSLVMAGLSSPTIFTGCMAVGVKAMMQSLAFRGIANCANGLYDEDKDSKNSEKLSTDVYSDYCDVINTHLTSLVELNSQYVSSNMITINYGATSNANMTLGDLFVVDDSENNPENYILNSINFELSIDDSYCKSWAIAMPVVKEAESKMIVYPPKGDTPLIREAKSQLANVVDSYDPSGLNRVRVRYPWQKGGGEFVKNLTDATPWIRMSLPMASSGGMGLNFMPNKGDEVMVNYENGNIERPYIDGVLYTAKNAPLNNKTANMYKYIKSGNGHTLTFYDNPDASDYLTNIVPFTSVYRSFYGGQLMAKSNLDTKKLGGYTMISDAYGMYNMKLSSDERKISISSPYGSVAIDAFEGITLAAPNGNVTIKGKNISLQAGNDIQIMSGTNIKNYIWNKKAKKDFADLTSSLTAQMLGPFIDFTFARTVIESFFRPMGGTLLIKSHRNVLVEAGGGSAAMKSGLPEISEKALKCVALFGTVLCALRVKYASVSFNPNADFAEYNRLYKIISRNNAIDLDLVKSDRSITKSNFNTYVPKPQKYKSALEINFDEYDADNLLSKIEAEKSAEYICILEDEIVDLGVHFDRIARGVFLSEVAEAVTMYNSLIQKYSSDIILDNLIGAVDDLTKRSITSFIQGGAILE